MADRDSFRAPGSQGSGGKPKRAGTFTFSSVRDSMHEKQRQAELDTVRQGAQAQFRQPAMPDPAEATETVRQAPGIEYEYKQEFQGRPTAGAGPQVGVRAQDLERTPLGAQTVRPDAGGTKQVDPSKLVMVHAAVLHDMEKRMQALEGEALMALPNIFLANGITPEVDLEDLEEVRPPAAAARKLRPSPFDLKGAKPIMGGEARGFPTPGEVATAAFPGAGGTLPPPTSPDDPLVKSGVYPEQALAPAAPRDPSRYQKTTRPKQDPMVGDLDDSRKPVSAPQVATGRVGVGGNKWGPVIDETVARQAEGLRSASDQMSETYAQDAQVRDQLAALQGGLVAPAFDEKERAMRRAKMSAERLDQASKLYLDQVYQGLDPDRVFGPGRLNRATVLAASIGNGNQLYSTGVAAPDMLGLIERVVDRDLDLQQAEIDNRGQAANSLLAQLQVALGDKDMAADAFRVTWLDMIKSEMEAMVPRIADAQQRAAMVEKIGGLDQYRAEARSKLEEAYLGRNLDAQKTNVGNALEAQKANASNTIAAAKANRSMNEKDAGRIDEFHKRWGTALTSIRGGRRLASLMRDSLAKFGKVPGMGNLFLSKTIDEARKYYEQLRSGAMQLGSPDETRAALDIAQAALEWQQKKFKSAKDGGAQSDWDTSLMQEVYGLLKNKDVNSVFNILGNDEHDVGDEYVVALRQAFPGDEGKHMRRYVMENNLPEWLTPSEREGAPSPTRKPEYPGQINLR